mgnify:CR=1 FL=1
MAQVLDKTKDIKIKGTITGKLTSPGFGISSDIDKKFTKAVNEITQAKIKEIQDNIKKEIDANIKKVQNDLMASSGLSQNDVGSLLKGDIQNVDAVNNAVEKEKGKLEKEQKKVQQKIQKELDAQKAKLEAEKKKVEAEQAVITTIEIAEANRRKSIEVIEATQQAKCSNARYCLGFCGGASFCPHCIP